MRDKKGENEVRIVVGGRGAPSLGDAVNWRRPSITPSGGWPAARRNQPQGRQYLHPDDALYCYYVDSTEEVGWHGGVEYHTEPAPLTPYTVAVRNISSKGNFAQLFVDGQKYVRGGRSVTFEGIPADDGIQELLFSLPRLMTLKERDNGGTSLPDTVANEIGTIKVVWRDCVKGGKEFSENYRMHPTMSSYKHANKRDAWDPPGMVAHEMRSSSTRAGKVIKIVETRSCLVDRYRYEGEPWSATVLYCTKEKLHELRVISVFESPEEVAERKRKGIARRKKRRKLLEESAARGPFVPPPVPVSLVDESPLVATERGESNG